MEIIAPQTPAPQEDVCVQRIVKIYRELLLHDGFGDLAVEVKLLKRGQKEVIIKSGKQYRYVVDVPEKTLRKD
ncbi:MAG: hypothetical protein LBH00_00795 [Planctomycetaceae bacterium]|jgi:hypothetical protein|nr:hypothetical protein [Planctomycetaceae bacterium]